MDGYCDNCSEGQRLFEAVTSEGLKNLCRRCLRLGNYPIIEKASSEQFKNQHRFYGNVEATPIPNEKKVDPELQKIDEELENIVLSKIKPGNYEDLIDNFHWTIQHARRMKKISTKQLSEHVAEPEALIVSAEKGELPGDYDKLISKLEQFLGVKIRKESKNIYGISNNKFDITKADLTSVKTSDLMKLKPDREIRNLGEDDEIEIISFEEED